MNKADLPGNTQFYLASASPRRCELLQQLGLRFTVFPQDIDEQQFADELPLDYVVRMAQEKALSALGHAQYQAGLPVLAADTIVLCDEEVMGKPDDLVSACRMLETLSGRTHKVITAITLANSRRNVSDIIESLVTFRQIEEDEMLAYWQTGEPRDKAGGYAIQGLGAMFVTRLEGSYSSVVGLPLFNTCQLLAHFGISSLDVLQGRCE